MSPPTVLNGHSAINGNSDNAAQPTLPPSLIPSATTLPMTSPPHPHHASLSLDRSSSAAVPTSSDSPAISVTTLPSPTSPLHPQPRNHPANSNSSYHPTKQRPVSYIAPTDAWDHPFFRPAVLHIDRPPRTHVVAQQQHEQHPPPTPNDPTAAAALPPTRPTVRIDQYTLGRTLGQGSMGKVKLATDPDGVRYAIKIIPRSGHLTNEDDAAAETRVVREASVLFLLNHPNIVKLVDALVTPQHFYLVMEFVDGPQLLDHVVARGRLSEDEARRVAVGLISAMDYCHHHHIVHRDLKIENILLTKSNQIKLLDFGLANFYDPHAHLHTFCGSLYFASPELISAQPYTGPEVDAWSLGVVLYVLVTARVPFDAPTLPELHAKIKRGNPTFPTHCSPELVDLLSRLLTVDPRTRATVHEAAAHPWLAGLVPLPVSNLVPADRDTRAAALVRRFGRGAAAHTPHDSAALDLGPLHEDATILLAQLTHLPVRDLQRGMGTPNHHLHALHVLTYEWLHRAYASAAARGELIMPTSHASLPPAPSAAHKRTSVALAHASAVAGRRFSYLGGGTPSLSRRPATGQLAAVDEAIVVSQAGSLQSRRASGSVMTMATSAAGTVSTTAGAGSWIMTDASLPAGAAAVAPPRVSADFHPSPPQPVAPGTPSLAPASPRSAHVHLTSAATGRRGGGTHGGPRVGNGVVPQSLPPTAPPRVAPAPSPPTGNPNGSGSGGGASGSGVHRATSASGTYTPPHPRPRTISGPTAGTAAPIVFSVPPPPPPDPAPMVLEAGRQREVSNESSAAASPGRQAPGAFKIEIQPLPANTAAVVQMEAAAARESPVRSPPASAARARGATEPGPAETSAVATRGPAAAATRQASAPPDTTLAADPVPGSTPASPARVVGRKPSMQSLFAGSHVISLPNGYAQPRAQGGLGIVDPIARIAQLAVGMHLQVGDVDAKQCVVTHRPSVNVQNRVTVAQVKLTRQGFGLLRPCLAFRQKSGDADAFRMVVQGLQREWMRVVVSNAGDKAPDAAEDQGAGGDDTADEAQVAPSASAVVAAA